MLTPVFEIDSKINWTATRTYKCDHCESKVAANDPRLIASLPMHMQQQSPCAANWVRPKARMQFGRGVTM